MGYCLVKGGHIFINRKNLKAAIGALDEAAKIMKVQKKCVCVAPEGTRRRTKSIDSGEHLLPFKKGPFHMAKTAECDIVHLSWQGINRISSGFLMRPGTLRLTIGNRIDKSEVARLSVDELMEKSRKAMISQLQPPMTDEEVYAVRQSRMPWLIFVVAHLVVYFLLSKLFR